MIITNWPDKCPNCRSSSFQVLRPVDSKIEPEGWVPTNNKLVRFICKGKVCDHQWTVELVGVDPTVVTHRFHNPMAVVTDSPSAAIEILAVDETWSSYKLSELIDRGAKRCTYVLERAEVQRTEDPKTAEQSGSC